MTTEFDPNRIAADYLARNLDNLVGLARQVLHGSRIAIRTRVEGTYRTYLSRVHDEFSRAKSFFVRSEPIPLYDFFVPLDLRNQRRHLPRATINSIVRLSSRAVITGQGGSGKSIFMRHLVVGAIQDGRRAPVFIELRQFNREPDSILGAIEKALLLHGLDLGNDFVAKAVEAGKFCLVLDGFDELNMELRESVAEDIKQFAALYPDNWIMISSRPDIKLSALDDFAQFEIAPLELDAAIELVRKLPFDDPIRERFIEDLRRELFAAHHSFLSNPLLLSIMLLTYTDVAHIPSKLSLFYQHAYEALFLKHDALKGGYQRERRSALDLQDFATAFSAFCLLSYDAGAFEFSRVGALEFFDRAKGLSQLDYQSSAVLDDARQAVCLLIDDGLNIAFSHRSFQEYFVAKFISGVSNQTAKDRLIRRVAERMGQDSVIALAHEMDPVSVERAFVLPFIADLRKAIGGLAEPVGPDQYLAMLRLLIDRIRCEDGGPFAITQAPSQMHWLYGFIFLNRLIEDSGKRPPRETDAAMKKWEKDTCALLEKEAGADGHLILATATSASPFIQHLFQGRPYFGGDFLPNVLTLEADIQRRHGQVQSSLEDILAKPVRRPRSTSTKPPRTRTSQRQT